MSAENVEMNPIGHDKNDLLACLIQEMKEARTVKERRAKAIDAILEYRKTAPRISDEEIYQIRQEFRDSIFVD